MWFRVCVQNQAKCETLLSWSTGGIFFQSRGPRGGGGFVSGTRDHIAGGHSDHSCSIFMFAPNITLSKINIFNLVLWYHHVFNPQLNSTFGLWRCLVLWINFQFIFVHSLSNLIRMKWIISASAMNLSFLPLYQQKYSVAFFFRTPHTYTFSRKKDLTSYLTKKKTLCVQVLLLFIRALDKK